ncbi:MAG: GNAT family N-acetyltransferase [Deltaproteobacteria bacterium CG23_combo_of_CG06-09_8_20_14_all_60_8]|nr:MAG: GNAT family N-acetyltransferase [Desulfobacterales bacterium CG2_30_60_27]PIP43250.1 MAG: GNAT family N-acetyltransferase [Deltaproteobacteria bacterium CG23_combo_of_CG06-09_8_20_14_all_60_8]
MIRNARMEDVKAIYALLKHYADQGLLLGRSLSSLYDQLRDFVVFDLVGEEIDREPPAGGLLGACALHVCWDDLAEIRSLAVAPGFHGRDIGTRLVRSCLEEASRFGIRRVFTLTYQPGFFEHFDFKRIDKSLLPHKVWSDCIQCPNFPDCHEEALIREDSGPQV